MIDIGGGACAVCGFAVRPRWAPQAPSAPVPVTAPPPVGPPPSQISVDRLEARWSQRSSGRTERTAAAAGSAAVAATPPLAARGSSGAAQRPDRLAQAAAWARQRQRELSTAPARSAPRRRPPLSMGRRTVTVFAMFAVLLAGLVAFSEYATQRSVRQAAGSGLGYSVAPLPAPRSGDLATVRRQFARLAAIVASPAVRVTRPRRAAAAQARVIRAGLLTWRDRFELSAHQMRVLDNAIAYAHALSRWLRAPQDPARRAAAVKTWRVWHADDPAMTTT
jgi:hypothetical protein